MVSGLVVAQVSSRSPFSSKGRVLWSFVLLVFFFSRLQIKDPVTTDCWLDQTLSRSNHRVTMSEQILFKWILCNVMGVYIWYQWEVSCAYGTIKIQNNNIWWITGVLVRYMGILVGYLDMLIVQSESSVKWTMYDLLDHNEWVPPHTQ